MTELGKEKADMENTVYVYSYIKVCDIGLTWKPCD